MTQPDEERPAELDVEAPEADAVEQSIPVAPTEVPSRPHVGFETDEGDAVAQSQVVAEDDEDYR